jgi:hydrogenase maturation protease
VSGRPSTPRAVVIGVGNVYRGDDGAGPEVARRVRALAPGWVEVWEHDGGAPDLLDLWEGADLAVVVDAVSSAELAPGHIHRLEVSGSSGVEPSPSVSSHSSSPGEAIELARALDRLPPRLLLYGIGARSFSFGLGLSPEVEAAITDVTERVVQELGRPAHRLGAGGRPPSTG